MRKGVIAVVCVSTVLFGCAGAPPRDDGTSLLPPPGLSLEQRKSDFGECYGSAASDARAKPALTASEKAPLQGRSTLKFFHSGRPVLNSAYTPSMMTTLSGYLGEQGNNEATDRYVLCFLSRGYTWPNPKAAN